MTLQLHTPVPASGPDVTAATSVAGEALVDALIATLDQVAEAAADPDPVEMVHDARKALKAYRAMLRLVSGTPAKTARREAAATARALSAARDRQAARDALAALVAAELISEADAAQAEGLIEMQPQTVDAGGDHSAQLLAYLDRARAEHADHLNAAARGADLVAGLRKGYAKAYAAKDWTRPESLHELRKRVVTHRYQMTFAAEISRGGKGEKRARNAQRLRDILGLYQDLEALKQLLAGALGTKDEAVMSEIVAASRTFQRRLVKQAQARHTRLFRHPPRHFAARMRQRLAPSNL